MSEIQPAEPVLTGKVVRPAGPPGMYLDPATGVISGVPTGDPTAVPWTPPEHPPNPADLMQAVLAPLDDGVADALEYAMPPRPAEVTEEQRASFQDWVKLVRERFPDEPIPLPPAG